MEKNPECFWCNNCGLKTKCGECIEFTTRTILEQEGLLPEKFVIGETLIKLHNLL